MTFVATFRNLFIRLSIPILCIEGILGDEQEYRLTRYLMANYDPSVRPAKNSTEALSVVFGLSLHSIIAVDEKNQILTTNCWLTQIWTDAHLTWNATDFGGIHVNRVPFQRAWKPDTVLYKKTIDPFPESFALHLPFLAPAWV
ncbi:neuronal acetylcholine receptor subunit alpha-3-like [Palaemon carinicauda]|uniref:neuronal acetylcholine receptor subunit alpha-3-like n=1 Tax=Palaemon carinicauda TaxID=392227 RepID=UPI0035B62162